MSNNSFKHSECSDQLDWSAFCYAAGEMSAAEAAEFEARLADDQLAREALAQAVELTQAVAAAETQLDSVVLPSGREAFHRSAGDWNLRVSWMAIGGLAALVLAILWSGTLESSLKTISKGRRSADQYELAAAWSQTRAELSSVKAAGLGPSVPSLHGETDDDLAINEALLDAPMGETPSWMDAAVLGLGGELSGEADGALGRAERLEN